MTQIILLNGPRGVGKTIAAENMRNEGWFCRPMIEGAKYMTLDKYSVPANMLAFYDQSSIKDVSCVEFDGLSFREAVIGVSADEKRRDPDVWVRNWRASFVPNGHPVTIMPDCRFYNEFLMACELVGGANVYLVRIQRPGHGWGGDVGEYIDDSRAVFGNASITLVNDLTEKHFLVESKHFAHQFVARRNLKL